MLFIASAFLALARFAAAQNDASATDIAIVQANFNGESHKLTRIVDADPSCSACP